MQRKYIVRDGLLVLSVDLSAPIERRTIDRYELLATAEGCSSVEEHIGDFGADGPEDDLEWLTHPPWENYRDLNFSQVLFGTALHGFGPWGQHYELEPDEFARTKGQFMAAISKWANFNEPCGRRELVRWTRAGEAAIRLDAKSLRKIVAPLVSAWL